jgi:hypothetical protein
VTEALLLLSTLLSELMDVPHDLPVLPLKIFDQLESTLFNFFSLSLTQQRNKLECLSREVFYSLQRLELTLTILLTVTIYFGRLV